MTKNESLLSNAANLLQRYAGEVADGTAPSVALTNVNPALVACGLPPIKRQASREALVRRLSAVRAEILAAIPEPKEPEAPAAEPSPEQPAPEGASEESLRYLEERGWTVERGPTPEEIEEQKRHAQAVEIAAAAEAEERKRARVRMLAEGAAVPEIVKAKTAKATKAPRVAKGPKAAGKRGPSKTAFVFERVVSSGGTSVEAIAADLEREFPGLVVSGGPRHFVRYILGRANAGDVSAPFAPRSLSFTKLSDGTCFVSVQKEAQAAE